MIVGPAGTGKTTALAAAVAQLERYGRPVFGVAPSAAAAAVLAHETGTPADTVHKLLSAQRHDADPDSPYRLVPGTTVIVDEAGMLSTDILDPLVAVASRNQWRLALVGDTLQFSAVGRGGMFGLLVDTFGAIELDTAHRFHHDWERNASLRLRRGDVDVLDLYDTHGRLHGGTADGMERAAVNAWWRHRQAGHDTLLMAPSNDTVDRLNERCQQLRVQAGELDPYGSAAQAADGPVLAGDEIATRHNDRRLLTDRREMVRNRATWMIDTVHHDGSIAASGTHGTIRLPADYVRDHVELAYATTAMGAQGRTVDHAILYLDSPADVRNIYVPLTRGRDSNHAYVATTGEDTAVDVVARCLTNDWIDHPAHTRRAELAAHSEVGSIEWLRVQLPPPAESQGVSRPSLGVEL